MPRQQLHTTATITPAAAQLDGTAPDLDAGERLADDDRRPEEKADTNEANIEASPGPMSAKRTGSRGHGPDRRRGEHGRGDETDRAGIDEKNNVRHGFHPVLISGSAAAVADRTTGCRRPYLPVGAANRIL